jgi:hypothetical protein
MEEMSEIEAILSKTMALKKMHWGGYKTRAKKKIPQIYCNAQESAPKARKMPPKPKRKGLTALEYMTSKGIALIGVYDSKASINNGKIVGDYAKTFTAEMETIKNLIAGNGDKKGRAKGIRINCFYFLPERNGLLCLDIDRKNGKDGIEEFSFFCEKIGKPRHLLPSYLQNLPESFPCYVSTLSSGFHFYFRYSGARLSKKTLSPETPGVEIKHGVPGLTSPGSYKNGKPYILHGNIENAPPFPAFILDVIEPAKQKPAKYIQHDQIKKERGKPTWEKLVELAYTDTQSAGRNDLAFNIAVKARNHNWTEAETLVALLQETGLDGLPENEIKTAVKSAFTRGETV